VVDYVASALLKVNTTTDTQAGSPAYFVLGLAVVLESGDAE
jgi:hypothetical protein